jgi:thiosulfate dehydrogenase (quinone) large subunit
MVDAKQITDERGQVLVQDPPIARFLFQDTRASWLWLAVRLFLAYQWLTSGLRKLGDAAWMDGGQALLTSWQRAVAVPDAPARPQITFDWYRAFIQYLIDTGSHVWFAKLVVFGEVAIGLGLLLGGLVGIAAFFGAFMNWNFLLLGVTSTNPMLLMLETLLVLAWKNAGWIGLDRFLLPLLGTPWWRPAARQGTSPLSTATSRGRA